ncbi:arcC [Symbiodinium sp. KB8]|nr:arcC [Symbiodinium sp. KB8]
MARLGFLGLRRALGVRSCASEARIIAEQVGPSSEKQRLKVVVAVGGNALIRRGERLTIENQLKAARNDAAPMLKKLMADHSVVLTHGNGPQVGELALERSAATFDVLGAESQGQIGYIFSQAMAGVGVSSACLVTQVVVDPTDAAFQNPTKFVGPVYGPLPIACGGGGVPVVRMGTAYANIPSHALEGMEAVIDKDRCGALLAQQLDADAFLILTDGGGIWRNFGKPDAKEMKEASISYLEGTKAGSKFPGSMGPKVAGAIEFVKNSPNPDAFAAIGDLNDAHAIFDNQAGTIIKKTVPGDVVWYDRSEEGKGTKVDRVPRNP